METFWWYANWLTVLLLCAAGFALVRRRLYREVPWFSAYVAYVIAFITTNTLITIHPKKPVGFYCFWIGTLISLFFAFMVIMEVFRHSVREHPSIRKFGVTALVIIAAIAVLFAVLMAPYGTPFENSTIYRQMAHALLVLQRSIRVVQIGLLLGIFTFATYLGLTWRNYIFGIALGYGLYASVNLVSSVVWEYVGARRLRTAADYVTAVDGMAYALTIILWITYLWRADRGKSDQHPPSGTDINKSLEEWSDALKPLAKASTLERQQISR